MQLDRVRRDPTLAVSEVKEANRALLATMILAGLRVGELCALRFRVLDSQLFSMGGAGLEPATSCV